MPEFFRKERPNIFAMRFSSPKPPSNAWSLTSHTIFEAKNANGTKNFTVITRDKKSVKLSCTVNANSLVITGASARAITLSEADIARLLAEKPDSISYLAISKICKDHAISSTNSPLISGCIVNNFDASKSYPGHKLHLTLNSRVPFGNPHVSGLEKEYFLVGSVLDTDCKLIKYLGATLENKNEIVNFFGSRIPRPART